MALSKERMGEIALLALKRQARNDGIKFGKRVKRGIGNFSKEEGVPIEELEAFARQFINELVEESLGK